MPHVSRVSRGRGGPAFPAFQRTMGFAFDAARARNEIFPPPSSPAPAQARPTDRRDSCSSAIPHSLGGCRRQTSFYRVAVHIPQFLYTFLVRPNIEVMEVSLR